MKGAAPAVRTDAQAGGSDERAAWIALAAVDGLGEVLVPRIVSALGGATEVLALARRVDQGHLARRLQAAAGMSLRRDTVAGVVAAAADPDAVMRRLQALGGWAVTPWDAAYPDGLRLIEPPIPALFGAGDVTALRADPLVAVVGTRRPTPLGRVLASRVAAALAVRGVTVVSGLAVGIDAAAHTATVDTGGRTIAVIGGGLASAWPRSHAALLARIRGGVGAVVGEHPPDTAATRGTFPRRNRIISGLAAATVVIEAPRGSGALITARHALEQGRIVFASPGRPSDPATTGCLELLRETPTRILAGVEELLVDLGLGDIGGGRKGAESAGRVMHAADALALLGGVEREVAGLLLEGPVSGDAIIRATGRTPAVVAGALTLLQLRGWVVPMGPLQVAAGPLLVRPPRPARATHRDPT